MKNFIRKQWIRCICLLALCLTAALAGQKMTAKAAGNYYLQVNKRTNVVTVYQSNGTPYKAFICSAGGDTPLGTFYTSQKLRWHELMGPVWGQYCTRITGSILFHSVWYYQNGNPATQSYAEYNKLGNLASHGCIRLTVGDAKWIYDNCPTGTQVRIIYGTSANDPLGKPSFMHMSGYQGWDPTDPDPRNPYARSFPSINTSGKGTTISCGDAFDYIAGISAKDSAGNDITSSITYEGTVDTSTLGAYTVKYSARDSLGRSTSATVTYQVVDNREATLSGVRAEVRKEYNSTYQLLSKIKAATADKKDLTAQIQVKVKAPGAKNPATYKKNTLKLSKTGTYKIYYTVINPNNQMISTKVTTVKVTDTKKPKLSGVKKTKTAGYNSVMNLKKGVTAKLVSGKSMTSKIKIEIKAPGAKSYKTLKASGKNTVNYKKYCFKKTGNYYVRYSIVNPNKKSSVTKQTLKITVKDVSKPKLTGVKGSATYEYGKVINLRSGIKAKMVSGVDITPKMTVKVKAPGRKTYVTLKMDGDEAKNRNSIRYHLNRVGTYEFVYRSTNPNKKSVYIEKKRKITVRDTSKPVIKGVTASKTIKEGEVLNLTAGVTASIPSNASLKVNVKVLNQAGTAVTGNLQSFAFNQTGTYRVVYTAENAAAKKSQRQATVTMTVFVNGSTPVITIPAPRTVEQGAEVNLLEGVTAKIPSNSSLPVEVSMVDASGKNVPVPANSVRSFVFTAAGTYRVTYKAVHPGDTKATSTQVLVITVTAKPEPTPTPDPEPNPNPDPGQTPTDPSTPDQSPTDPSAPNTPSQGRASVPAGQAEHTVSPTDAD